MSTNFKFLGTDESFPALVVSGIMGMKQTGKSLYSFEQGYALIKQEGNGGILYLGTEEVTDVMFTQGNDGNPSWRERLDKKYGISPKYEYIFLPNVEEFLKFFGINGRLVIKPGRVDEKNPEKTKGMTLDYDVINMTLENTPLEKKLKEGFTYIVIDSMTAMFDSLAISGNQNFPKRHQAEEIFFLQLNQLLYKLKQYNVRVFTTHHITFNPTDSFAAKMNEKMLVAKGGKAIWHYTKMLYGLKAYMRPHGARQMVVVRYPNLPEYGKEYTLLIDGTGIARADAKQLERIKGEQKEDLAAQRA